MIAYASRTGTKRNLSLLRKAGWHLLVSAKGVLRTEGFPFALDNGAWTAFQQNHDFDVDAFTKALALLGRHADWVVAPDIVGGGMASHAMSCAWLPRVLDQTERVLFAVQDGMTRAHVAHLLGPRVGIFVGGSTEWKLRTLADWALLARMHGAWCHVGRVNSARRIARCAAAGVWSVDGTSATRFAETLEPLDRAVRQTAFLIGV